MIAKNAPEWWIITIGLIAAFCVSTVFPVYSILFGEILEALSLPSQQILKNIHLWAGIYLLTSVISGIGKFVKVWEFAYIALNHAWVSREAGACIIIHLYQKDADYVSLLFHIAVSKLTTVP